MAYPCINITCLKTRINYHKLASYVISEQLLLLVSLLVVVVIDPHSFLNKNFYFFNIIAYYAPKHWVASYTHMYVVSYMLNNSHNMMLQHYSVSVHVVICIHTSISNTRLLLCKYGQVMYTIHKHTVQLCMWFIWW